MGQDLRMRHGLMMSDEKRREVETRPEIETQHEDEIRSQ